MIITVKLFIQRNVVWSLGALGKLNTQKETDSDISHALAIYINSVIEIPVSLALTSVCRSFIVMFFNVLT
jgi:hypothetical protein